MARWNGQSRGNRWGYSLFFFLLRHGGLGPAYFLLRFVSLYYVLFMPKAVRPLRYLYERRLGMGRAEARRTVRRNFYVFGQTLIDKVVVMGGLPHRFEIEHTGGHFLDQLVTGGQGGILVSAHLGNYELAGHLLQRLDATINIVMYDGEEAQIKAYLEKITGPKHFKLILIKEDLSHIYELSAALRRNELICIHADRYMEGNRTIAHDFLGQAAHFPLGPFVLASKLKAPVCFVFALKEGERGYHFFGHEPRTYAGLGDEGARAMLGDYVRLLEEKVRRYPEQWFNYFDFWALPEEDRDAPSRIR